MPLVLQGHAAFLEYPHDDFGFSSDLSRVDDKARTRDNGVGVVKFF